MKKNGLFKNLIITWKYMTGAKLYLFLYFLVAVVDCAVGVVIPLFSAKVILNMTSAAIHQLILAAITVFVIEFLGTITEILKEKLYSECDVFSIRELFQKRGVFQIFYRFFHIRKGDAECD